MELNQIWTGFNDFDWVLSALDLNPDMILILASDLCMVDRFVIYT